MADKNSDKPVTDLDAVHALALRRFQENVDSTQEMRAMSLMCRRFATIPGAQWEDEQWQAQFENTIRVEINKTARGCEKITDDYRANRVTVNYRAVGGVSSEDTAKTLEGMFRADSYHFKSSQAFDNAFDEAVLGGFGAWRLTSELNDPSDYDDESQRVNPGMAIVDADQRVFFDLNSKLYDKSDAKWAIIMTALTSDAFEAEYPDSASSWPDSAIMRPTWEWFQPDICFVAEYYVVEMVPDVRLTLTAPLTGAEERFWLSDLEDDKLEEMLALGWSETARRKLKRRRVHKYTLSGNEVLSDDGYIAGECIPIVPVYGKRWYVENMERWRGHVQLAMDPQRVYNAQISSLTETAALAPREVPIFTPEQVLGHDQKWAAMNIERHPYALVNPIIGPDGQPIASGPVGKVESPQLSPVLAALIQISSNDIDELTNGSDGADETKSNVSAAAMDIAATRVDAKSATYMDNMRQSMQRDGEIYLSMTRDVCFEPGRKVETMENDGTFGEATLAEQVTTEQGASVIRNDLARGRYSVISDVMEATPTRRDKSVRALLNVANVAGTIGDTDMAQAALTTAVLQMDGEGLSDFQAYLRRKSVASGLVKPTKEEEQQLAAAQGQQQPDPTAIALQAQAAALAAQADKDAKLADKAVADTQLSRARVVQTLADASATAAQTERDGALATADIDAKRAQVVRDLMSVPGPAADRMPGL